MTFTLRQFDAFLDATIARDKDQLANDLFVARAAQFNEKDFTKTMKDLRGK